MPTRTSVASRKRAAADPETKMLRAVGEYLESKGWNCMVARAHRIQQAPGIQVNTNFELVIRFTGGRMKEPDADSKRV